MRPFLPHVRKSIGLFCRIFISFFSFAAFLFLFFSFAAFFLPHVRKAIGLFCRINRPLLPRAGRGRACVLRYAHASKEACLCGKRGLFMRTKRSVYAAKDANLCGKRGLFMRQKRPINFSISGPCYCYLSALLLYVFTTVCLYYCMSYVAYPGHATAIC